MELKFYDIRKNDQMNKWWPLQGPLLQQHFFTVASKLLLLTGDLPGPLGG